MGDKLTQLLGSLDDDTRRSFLRKGAAGLAVGGGLTGVAGSAAAQEDGEDDGTETPQEDDGTETPEDDGEDDSDDGSDDGATIEFRNQSSDGTEVTVESVTLPDGGYVAFHDTSLLDGEVLGSVVGVSEYLDSGTSEDVDVTLFDVEGADLADEELSDGQALVPMPHRETGDNETYDFVATDGEEDGPYTRAGAPVVDLGYVAVDGS